MSGIMHRDPRTMFPDLVDWFEEPFLTLRPYLGQAIKIEECTQDGRYVLRAEIPGIDPDKDLEVITGPGYLSIRAHRAGVIDDKHRTEFRYGRFSRIVELPKGANMDDVTADYAQGILTITAGLKDRETAEPRSIKVTSGK